MTNDNTQWLVVATKPQQEERAEINLRRQAEHFAEVYCPRIKMINRIKALFPSYLFVKVANNGNIRLISNTYGVRTLVKVGDQIATVANDQISEIKSRESNGMVKLECPYKSGDKLSWGPIPVIFEKMLDDERCSVLYSMLGASRNKILNLSSLGPAHERVW